MSSFLCMRSSTCRHISVYVDPYTYRSIIGYYSVHPIAYLHVGSVCLSVCRLSVCLSVCLFICMSICLSACLSVCLHLTVYVPLSSYLRDPQSSSSPSGSPII